MYDVVIIGGGPAGLSAAIYTARAQLKTVVIEKGVLGGQISQTTEVENYPGFPAVISGLELTERMVHQAKKFNAEIITDTVKRVIKHKNYYMVIGDEENYLTRSVILASGSSSKKLGIPGEDLYYGRGVSTCATCDGYFYRGKTAVVVGGGDSAVEEATYLTRFAESVVLIYRADKLKANKHAQEKARKNNKITFLSNTVVNEIIGDGKSVNGVRIRNTTTEEENVIKTDGVFVYIGHYPNTYYISDLVETTKSGYIKVTDEVYTSEKGIFSAGDVSDEIYKQLGTSVGTGIKAAMVTERYLSSIE